MKKIKQRKGITLISLVITIIILLILAGITIASLTNDNGLFSRAKQSKEEYEIGADEETLTMEYSEYNIDKLEWKEDEQKTFLEYLEEKEYIVFYYDENDKTSGEVTLNGRIYEVDEKGNIKYAGISDGKVRKIKLDKQEATIGINKTITLNATVLPNDAIDKTLEWSSEKNEIATVSETGEVKGIAEGKTTIICRSKDGGASAICSVEVINGNIIYTRSDLENISNNPTENYIIMNDIDLGEKEWEPIVDFSGTLNGNGYTIKNMFINSGDGGLFDKLKIKSIVKNIKFENVKISSNNYCDSGVIAAESEFINNNDTIIIESIAIESGEMKSVTGFGNVGSFVGNSSKNLVIKNCYSSMNFIDLDIDRYMNKKYGGLIGNICSYIQNAYWDGLNNTTGRFSPLLPYGVDEKLLINCYYNKDKFILNFAESELKGNFLTTEQFVNQSNFEDWDFKNIWIMKDGRPELRIFVKDE